MTISAAEFKKAIEALENGAELLEFHTAAVAQEKEFGKTKYAEKDKEAVGLRKYKALIKNLGWDGESDPEEFVTTVQANLENRQTEGNAQMVEVTKQLKKLQKDFETSQTELQAEREQKTALQQQNKLKTIENTLAPKLSESFYGHNFMIKALIADGQVDLDEKGQVIFKNGESVMEFDKGLKWLEETHSDARKNTQKPGGGSVPANQGGAKPKYTMAQIDSMTPAQLAADIVNVNASLKAVSGK